MNLHEICKGKPVSGVVTLLSGKKIWTLSLYCDEDGEFSFRVEDGMYWYYDQHGKRIRKEGYYGYVSAWGIETPAPCPSGPCPTDMVSFHVCDAREAKEIINKTKHIIL